MDNYFLDMSVFSKATSPKLAGIGGTFCSGKDTGSRYLEERGFMHVSCGDILRAEATRQGRDHERPTLVEIGVELNRQYGSLGARVLKGIERWEESRDQFLGGLVVSGLRVVGEAEEIQFQKGTLIFTDAPVRTRYERAKARAIEEGRTVELGGVGSVEDFIESERAELEGLGGPERPNLRGVEAIADAVIQNVGTRAEYFQNLDRVLGLVA